MSADTKKALEKILEEVSREIKFYYDLQGSCAVNLFNPDEETKAEIEAVGLPEFGEYFTGAKSPLIGKDFGGSLDTSLIVNSPIPNAKIDILFHSRNNAEIIAARDGEVARKTMNKNVAEMLFFMFFEG